MVCSISSRSPLVREINATWASSNIACKPCLSLQQSTPIAQSVPTVHTCHGQSRGNPALSNPISWLFAMASFPNSSVGSDSLLPMPHPNGRLRHARLLTAQRSSSRALYAKDAVPRGDRNPSQSSTSLGISSPCMFGSLLPTETYLISSPSLSAAPFHNQIASSPVRLSRTAACSHLPAFPTSTAYSMSILHTYTYRIVMSQCPCKRTSLGIDAISESATHRRLHRVKLSSIHVTLILLHYALCTFLRNRTIHL